MAQGRQEDSWRRLSVCVQSFVAAGGDSNLDAFGEIFGKGLGELGAKGVSSGHCPKPQATSLAIERFEGLGRLGQPAPLRLSFGLTSYAGG